MLLVFFPTKTRVRKMLNCCVLLVIFFVEVKFSSWFTASLFYFLPDVTRWLVSAFLDKFIWISGTIRPFFFFYLDVSLIEVTLINFCLLTLLHCGLIQCLVLIYGAPIEGWAMGTLFHFSLITTSHVHLLLRYFKHADEFNAFLGLLLLIDCLYLDCFIKVFRYNLLDLRFCRWIAIEVSLCLSGCLGKTFAA